MDAYRIAYDGHAFHGFQRQPDVRTVSDTILDALRVLDVIDGDVPEEYAAAGRTDAGVSALAQTVALEAPPWLTPAALNSALPASVRAWAHADAPERFHATHDAAAREYTYFLHAPEADPERAREATDSLTGEYDFHNLTPDDTGTVRDLTLTVSVDGPFLVLTARADGFARQLVRRLVTVVEAVATGRAEPTWIDRVLGEAVLDGPEGIAPAPPHPLVLTDVRYPSLTFERDTDAVDSVREVFGDRAAEFESRARVARHVVAGVGR